MPHAQLWSRTIVGLSATAIGVEVHLTPGLPKFTIVGMPETSIQESKERVRSALMSCDYNFPQQRITINLTPAKLPKSGSHFDLPIALGILIASKQLQLNTIDDFECMGELSLTGLLQPIASPIQMALACAATNKAMILPEQNAQHLHYIPELRAFGATHLRQVVNHLNRSSPLQAISPKKLQPAPCHTQHAFDAVIGQAQAKRALCIAAAGGHHVLMVGPPGTGKSMLAEAFSQILPPLNNTHTMETAAIAQLDQSHAIPCRTPPFRHPHHSVSSAGLLGGGNPPQPGEITKAHWGVLFLDELTEFNRNTLEQFREPLESGQIVLARAGHSIKYPCKFQLLAAMNPCPCGLLGHPTKPCQCSFNQRRQYLGKLSNPLLERIAICIQLQPEAAPQTTQTIEQHFTPQQIHQAQNSQNQRQGCCNQRLINDQMTQHCRMSNNAKTTLQDIATKQQLSRRTCNQVIKVARTIADLEQDPTIKTCHIEESLGYCSIAIIEQYRQKF